MALESQLYISKYVGRDEQARSDVEDIVSLVSMKNASISVTGALIFTGKHFAQILEGESESLDRLMASIARDPRHEIVKTFVRTKISDRRFPSWGLAYAGQSHFVSGHIARLITSGQATTTRRGERWLIELMEEFSG